MSQEKSGRKQPPHYPVEVKQAAVDRVRAGASMAKVAAENRLRAGSHSLLAGAVGEAWRGMA